MSLSFASVFSGFGSVFQRVPRPLPEGFISNFINNSIQKGKRLHENKKNQKIFLQTDFDVPMMWGEWILRRKKDGVVWAAGKAARTCPSFWVRFSVSETGRACRFTGFSASAFLLLLSVFPRVHQALLQLGLQVLLLYCCRQRLTLEVHELHVHQRGVRK